MLNSYKKFKKIACITLLTVASIAQISQLNTFFIFNPFFKKTSERNSITIEDQIEDALEKNDIKSAKKLIAKKINTSPKESAYETFSNIFIDKYIRNKDLDKLKKFFLASENILEKKLLKIYLYTEIATNNLDILEILLFNNINISNIELFFLISIQDNNHKVIELLLKYKANVEEDMHEKIDESLKYRLRSCDRETIKIILKNITNFDIPTYEFEKIIKSCIDESDCELLDLLNKKINLYEIIFCNNDDNTALKYAIIKNNKIMTEKIIGYLLENKELKKEDFKKYLTKALIFACKKNKLDFLDLLIKHGADFEDNSYCHSFFINCHIASAIKFACNTVNFTLLQTLIQNGAKVSERHLCCAVLKLTQSKNDTEKEDCKKIINFLIENDANINNALFLALDYTVNFSENHEEIHSNNVDYSINLRIADQLISLGANINLPLHLDYYGRNLLTCLCSKNEVDDRMYQRHLEFIRYISKNVRADIIGQALLNVYNAQIAEILLDAYPDAVNYLDDSILENDERLETPLFRCIIDSLNLFEGKKNKSTRKDNCSDIINLLLNKGAKITNKILSLINNENFCAKDNEKDQALKKLITEKLISERKLMLSNKHYADITVSCNN